MLTVNNKCAKRDKSFLFSDSSRETYISKTTQNLLLPCCYDIMAETIIGRVKEAKFYSVFCDETSDASNKKQLTFCLRYVNDDGDI